MTLTPIQKLALRDQGLPRLLAPGQLQVALVEHVQRAVRDGPEDPLHSRPKDGGGDDENRRGVVGHDLPRSPQGHP